MADPVLQVDCEVGAPRVNYREAITKRTDFDYLHKKQSGQLKFAPRISHKMLLSMHSSRQHVIRSLDLLRITAF